MSLQNLVGDHVSNQKIEGRLSESGANSWNPRWRPRWPPNMKSVIYTTSDCAFVRIQLGFMYNIVPDMYLNYFQLTFINKSKMASKMAAKL